MLTRLFPSDVLSVWTGIALLLDLDGPAMEATIAGMIARDEVQVFALHTEEDGLRGLFFIRPTLRGISSVPILFLVHDVVKDDVGQEEYEDALRWFLSYAREIGYSGLSGVPTTELTTEAFKNIGGEALLPEYIAEA